MTIDTREDPLIASALKAGLSLRAAIVYITLLRTGLPLSPKAIIIHSRLHRQYVFDGLEELERRSLVVRSGTGKRVKYEAESPDRLIQHAERARIDALEGAAALMRLYDQSPAGTVEVIRGTKAVIGSEFDELHGASAGSFLDIIGGAGMRWVEFFEKRIPEWEGLRKAKDIRLRYIGSGDDVRHNREASIIENESRIIPGIGDIVNVAIRPDSVSFNIYVPEVMTVRVRDTSAVASQRALFEVLWNIAQ